jgi:hypothetical protein
MNEPIARRWCEAIARTLQVEHIQRDQQPYLERYYVAGWNPITRRAGPALFLHHFVASDGPQVHSHPWASAVSLILVGGYREERCTPSGVVARECRPGDLNVLDPETKHRVDLLGADCWSLLLVGTYAQPWRFENQC